MTASTERRAADASALLARGVLGVPGYSLRPVRSETEPAAPAAAPPGDRVTAPAPPAPTRRDQLRMVLLSFLLLFLELALIRWTGENIVHLSYFTNFVLLGSFLGIGLGFLRANRRVNLFPYAPILLAGLVAFVRFFPVELSASGGNFIYFGNIQASGPPRALVLIIVFVAVAAVMMAIAEGVARTFKRFEPLDAYRLDLVGSVLGILAVSLLSLLSAPSIAWGAVVGVLLLGLEGTGRTTRPWLRIAQVIAFGTILVLLGFESFAPGISWSPYYKIKTIQLNRGFNTISVNGVLHQANLHYAIDPNYSLLYGQLAHSRLDNVLVIGAGGGNDVSVALARGARHVDAVEIDPRIAQIGREIHPDHPYRDPRVSVHTTDGRAFLQQTDRRYDLILLALTDSITLVPGQGSVRLESYLFTKQAIETARDHLKPHGVYSMYNFYRLPWLLDRFAGTLNQVFGHPPCRGDNGTGETRFTVLVDAPNRADVRCASVWRPSGAVPSPATDDHPFPYLRNPSVPSLYIVTDLLILGFSILMVRLVAGRMRSMGGYLDLFFLGLAFLLLETKNIVQFALLFGTTWFVNALVFLGILLTVLLAVELCRHVRFRRPARLYLLLFASLAVAWAVPPSALLSLGVVPRFLAATALAFAPVFFANLIFSNRFRDVGSSTTAFGVNLLGAMVGGLLEYATLIVGYRALLIVVAAAYGLAFAFGRSHLVGREAALQR
jgi:Spermine/spermidine synthase domain